MPQIAEILENLEKGKFIEIQFKSLQLIDHACIDLLLDWSNRYVNNGGKVVIDWNTIQKIYPNFGWDTINEIYSNFDLESINKDFPELKQTLKKSVLKYKNSKYFKLYEKNLTKNQKD